MTTCNGCERRRTALKQLFFGTLGAARSVRRLAAGAAIAALGMPAIGRATLRDTAPGSRNSQAGDMPMWAKRTAWGGGATGTLQLTLYTWLAAGTLPTGPRTAWGGDIVLAHRLGQILPRKLGIATGWFNQAGGCNYMEAWIAMNGYAYEDWNIAFARIVDMQDGKYYACGSNCVNYEGSAYNVNFDFNA